MYTANVFPIKTTAQEITGYLQVFPVRIAERLYAFCGETLYYLQIAGKLQGFPEKYIGFLCDSYRENLQVPRNFLCCSFYGKNICGVFLFQSLLPACRVSEASWKPRLTWCKWKSLTEKYVELLVWICSILGYFWCYFLGLFFEVTLLTLFFEVIFWSYFLMQF